MKMTRLPDKQTAIKWGSLVLLILFALAMRLPGLDNGLPYSQLPDETADMSTSLRLASGAVPERTLRRVGWPVSQLPVHGLHYVILKVSQPDFSFQDYEDRYFTHRGEFLFSIRLYVAILASLSVAGVYLVVKSLSNSHWAGIMAGLLLAAHPTSIYFSQLGLPDGYSLSWVVVTLAACVFLAQSGKRSLYILAGAGAAMVTLARFQHITITLSVALAHFIYWRNTEEKSRKELLTRWLWSFGAFVVVMLLFNPFIVLQPGLAYDDGERELLKRLRPDLSLMAHWRAIVNNTPFPATMMRSYLALVAAIATVYALVKRNWLALVLVIFELAVIVSLAPLVRTKVTYLMPVIISGVMLAGYLLGELLASDNKWLVRAALVGYVVLLGWTLAEGLKVDTVLARPNTKMAAYDWVVDNIPEDAAIMTGELFAYSVPLQRNEVSTLRLDELESLPESDQYYLEHPGEARTPRYDIFGPEYRDIVNSDADWWTLVEANGIQYVIESDYCGPNGYRYDANSNLQFPVVTDAVRGELELVAIFSPFTDIACQEVIHGRMYLENMRLSYWESVGPVIRIYEVVRLPE